MCMKLTGVQLLQVGVTDRKSGSVLMSRLLTPPFIFKYVKLQALQIQHGAVQTQF